jgi:hypothetical protein
MYRVHLKIETGLVWQGRGVLPNRIRSYGAYVGCMGSLLGAPGGLDGSLLGQADSFALKVRSLLLPGVQDPSNQCLLHMSR